MNTEEVRRRVRERPYWYHTFEIAPGVVTPGGYEISDAVENMRLPQNLAGKRVLEIGPADGAFTKTLWERGADMTVVDYAYTHNFALMQEITGCKARVIECNVLEIDTLGLAPFDIVIMMGVLYHLPDPLRGIWLMRQLVRPDGLFILETLISTRPGPPSMDYLPASSLNNDDTNFWAPNVACINGMLSDCGFAVEREVAGGTRAIFHARANATPLIDTKAARAYSLR